MGKGQNIEIVRIAEGLLVGAVAGLVVALYHLLFAQAGAYTYKVLAYIEGNIGLAILWLAALIGLAGIVYLLLKWEPMAAGGGIAQVEAEIRDKSDGVWWRIIAARFIGGALTVFAGLSVGREGPSIQLGSMTGKGVARLLRRRKEVEHLLFVLGTGAGLSASFHAPVAGVVLVVEELFKKLTLVVLIAGAAASLCADLLYGKMFGLEPFFQFDLGDNFAAGQYGMLVALGIVMGIVGYFYNFLMRKTLQISQSLQKVHFFVKLMFAFVVAGVLGLILPEVLGSGQHLILGMIRGEIVLGMAVLLLTVKLLFSALSLGSMAPGGIFFPTLVIGAMSGGIFGLLSIRYFGLDPVYLDNIVILGIIGCFMAVVHKPNAAIIGAPFTGMVLVLEITNATKFFPAVIVVVVFAYGTAMFVEWVKDKANLNKKDQQ